MASGTPLVTTRVGQATEIVDDGVTGLLADVDDVDGLAEGVQRVHEDSELAARLRTAARPVAEANADGKLDPRWAELLKGFVDAG
jgi:glycosyltransferase involved in cell wall biosynthesis